jgi:hypothetical protein
MPHAIDQRLPVNAAPGGFVSAAASSQSSTSWLALLSKASSQANVMQTVEPIKSTRPEFVATLRRVLQRGWSY